MSLKYPKRAICLNTFVAHCKTKNKRNENETTERRQDELQIQQCELERIRERDESALEVENKAHLHASKAALQSEDHMSSAPKETLSGLRNELPLRTKRVSFPTHLFIDTPTISEPDIPGVQATA